MKRLVHFSPSYTCTFAVDPDERGTTVTDHGIRIICLHGECPTFAMAENILKHFHGRQIYVGPVGVRAGEIDGFAVEILDEIGIDLSASFKNFDDLEDEFYDLIITLSPEAQLGLSN